MKENTEVSKIEHFQGAAEVTEEVITLCETLYDCSDDKVVRVVKKMGLKLEGVHGWLEDVATGRDANGKLEADLLEISNKLYLLWHPFYEMARGGSYRELGVGNRATVRVKENGQEKEYTGEIRGGHFLDLKDVVALDCLIGEAYKRVTKLYQMR